MGSAGLVQSPVGGDDSVKTPSIHPFYGEPKGRFDHPSRPKKRIPKQEHTPRHGWKKKENTVKKGRKKDKFVFWNVLANSVLNPAIMPENARKVLDAKERSVPLRPYISRHPKPKPQALGVSVRFYAVRFGTPSEHRTPLHRTRLAHRGVHGAPAMLALQVQR